MEKPNNNDTKRHDPTINGMGIALCVKNQSIWQPSSGSGIIKGINEYPSEASLVEGDYCNCSNRNEVCW